MSNGHKELSSRIHKGKPVSDKAISKAIEVNSKILFLIDSTNRVVKTYKSHKEIIKGYKLVTKLKE